MSRSSAQLLACAAALFACSGCLKTIYLAGPDGYVTTQSAEGGEHFRVRIRNDFGLWGLVPAQRVIEVDRAVSLHLAREVRNISNLRIRQELSPLNALLQFITLGLYTPRTLEIEGMIHAEPPFPPARDPPKPPAEPLDAPDADAPAEPEVRPR